MGVFIDYVGQSATPAGGHYRLSCRTTGLTTTQASLVPIFSLRWTDPVHYFVLLDFKIGVGVNTAYTTAQIIDAYLYVARQYTVADTTNTTAVAVPSGNMAKMRDFGGSQMSSSSVSSILVANTAGMTGSTRTLDTQPIGASVLSCAAALGSGAESQLYSCNFGNDHPLVLGVNEGLVVTIFTAIVTPGTSQYYFNLRWAEVTQF